MAEGRESAETGFRRWLITDGGKSIRTADFVGMLCRGLVDQGVPVDRVLVSVQTIHPQILATAYLWNAGHDVVGVDRGHDIANDREYLNSPFRCIHDGADELRARLVGEGADLSLSVPRQLASEGYSDYLALAFVMSDGTRNAISFASKSPGGFSDDDIAFLKTLMPIVSIIVERQSSQRIAQTLLDTYVGHHAGERILNGEIRRGMGQKIHAVIWYGDLRNFTAMSDTRPTEEVIGSLNDYFELMASAVHRHGGQVLKFIGDGILAMFNVGDAAFRHYACRQALDAAMEVEDAIDALNLERDRQGLPPLDFGLGLHIGELVYGNIGSVDRLDYTVIGPAVNLTARLEALSTELGVALVISKDFADTAAVYQPLSSLGRHVLRGVREPQEVFTLPRDVEKRDAAAMRGVTTGR